MDEIKTRVKKVDQAKKSNFDLKNEVVSLEKKRRKETTGRQQTQIKANSRLAVTQNVPVTFYFKT